tara:strand:+ start:1724 stop:3496 length:1773 start_codon:yes stop_codon:yes gene_type:complete
MQLVISFLSSFLLTELIFINSQNFQIELFAGDIERFLRLDDISINYSFISLIVALLNVILIYFNKKLNTLDSAVGNKFLAYLLANSLTTLFIFYFFRIYTVSRIFVIASLLVYPLLLILFETEYLKSPQFKYTSILILLGLNIYMFSNPVNNSELSGYKPESVESENKKPIDYYPDLEMLVVDGVTNILDYYPSHESIIEEYKDFDNQLTGRYSFGDSYEIYKYSMCCYWLEYSTSGGKPIGYLENYQDNLIYTHGSGIFSFANKKEILSGDFKFNTIDSNFREIINNKFIYERNPQFDNKSNGWESVRDLLIVNDQIFVSFVNEKYEDCVNIEILSADFNYNFLKFKYFFTSDECVMRTDYPLYNPMVAGGKLLNINNKNIYFATGDFRNWEKAQDENSYLGKVLSIDINNSSYEIISKGHRNPQGLSLTKNADFIIETEHGPVGGDEINLINVNSSQNFGWPVSSYGKHWQTENYEMKDGIASLHNSHEDYGMREPLFYQYVGFFGGIGISDVEINHFKERDSFFVATLNGAQIFDIDVDIEENKMTDFVRYKVDERIRDMEYDPQNQVYYLLLEYGPTFAVLTQYDK